MQLTILRRIVALAALGALGTGCGTDVEITLGEPRLESLETPTSGEPLDADPSNGGPESAIEPTNEVALPPFEIPTPTPAAPASTIEGDDEAASTEAGSPPSTLGLAPLLFVVAPNASLLGVELGTETEAAMDQLVGLMGVPDADSGWYPGCPLDGEADDERLVQWGDLNVYFRLFGERGVMEAWGYDLRTVVGGFPEVDLVLLPGGATIGDPVNEVADAAGLDVRYDDVFEINRVGEPGYEIVAEAPPGAPTWGAFVPAVPACE